MQLPDFNHTTCKWDEWRAMHHVHYHNFVQFDTGELIATRWYVRDRYRYTHGHNLGVEVLASDDIYRSFCAKRTLKTPDGDKISKSWFPSSRGYIFDKDTHMLIKTGELVQNPNVPTRFHNRATAYWAGPGREPIGAPLKLTKPRTRTPEEKEKANDMRALAKAWRKLTDDAKMWSPVYGSDGVPLDLLMDKEFETLPEHMKVRIAQNGLSGPWETITLPYVKVETI